MARGVALSLILAKLRAEIGQTLNTAAATGDDAGLMTLVQNEMDWLSREYSFPFLEQRWDVPMVGGTRFYALPSVASSGLPPQATVAINFERPVKVERFFNNFWDTITYGIGAEEYNYRNSDLGLGYDPIMRWRHATNTTDPASSYQDYFEVWPIPQSNVQTIRFTGQRALQVFFNPAASVSSQTSNKCELDDLLLINLVAAKKLLQDEPARAKMLLNQAQEILTRLMGAYKQRDDKLILGDRRYKQSAKRRLLPIVVVR